MARRRKSHKCYSCGGDIEERRMQQGYCLKCHASYMRHNRVYYKDLSTEQRQKSNARAYLRVYVKRGKIIKEPCEKCGSMFVEAHHEDYSKPLQVRWLCRKCHLDEHGFRPIRKNIAKKAIDLPKFEYPRPAKQI